MANISQNIGRLPVSRGDYSDQENYYRDNIVLFQNMAKQCVVDGPIQGVLPTDNTKWRTFAGIPVVQELGNSETSVISQKVVSEKISVLKDKSDYISNQVHREIEIEWENGAYSSSTGQKDDREGVLIGIRTKTLYPIYLFNNINNKAPSNYNVSICYYRIDRTFIDRNTSFNSNYLEAAYVSIYVLAKDNTQLSINEVDSILAITLSKDIITKIRNIETLIGDTSLFSQNKNISQYIYEINDIVSGNQGQLNIEWEHGRYDKNTGDKINSNVTTIRTKNLCDISIIDSIVNNDANLYNVSFLYYDDSHNYLGSTITELNSNYPGASYYTIYVGSKNGSEELIPTSPETYITTVLKTNANSGLASRFDSLNTEFKLFALPKCFIKKIDNSQVYIYTRIKENYYVEFRLIHEVFAQDYPTFRCNSDYWRQADAYLCTIEGNTVNVLYKVLTQAENEHVFQFNNVQSRPDGTYDHSGSYHGDEFVDSMNIFVNGIPMDIDSIPTDLFPCDTVYYAEKSHITGFDTINDNDVIANHFKLTHYLDGGYTTENTMTFIKASTIGFIYAGLVCISKNVCTNWSCDNGIIYEALGDNAHHLLTDVHSDNSSIRYWSTTSKSSATVQSKVVYGIPTDMLRIEIWDRPNSDGDVKYYNRTWRNNPDQSKRTIHFADGEGYKVISSIRFDIDL